MTSSLRRAVTAATATGAALVLALTASPAVAVTPDAPEGPVNERYSSSGRILNLDWLEVGRLPGGVLGNYHYGYMGIDVGKTGETFVYGSVVDLECPPGVTPEDGHGGGHGEEPEGPFCEEVAFRSIDGGDLTVQADKRNRNARITGTLAVSDHGTPLGNPAVDITLTGTSTTFVNRYTNVYRDGGVTYTSTFSESGRQATVAGRIGPMVFDDAEGEYSSATIGSYSQVSKTRVRKP